jgi:dienelactone hydrolase
VGAVSFHGGLTTFEVTKNMSHPVLVLSGGDDDTGSAVEDLENRLNSANATWQITRYSGIEHAFTVFEDARYNPRVDQRSWDEMASFLHERFGHMTYGTVEPETTSVVNVTYDDNGFALKGYLAVPESPVEGETAAVVIVPAWAGTRGPNGYEAERATMLAAEGYVGFVADIYGEGLEFVADFDLRRNLSSTYRNDPDLFVSRIQAAVDVVANHPLVNPDKIVMVGYCFGGTGNVDYAFSGLTNVKAVVPVHGGLTPLRAVKTDKVYPEILVLSGKFRCSDHSSHRKNE